MTKMNRRQAKRNAHAICPVNSSTIWCENSAHWRQRIQPIRQNPEHLRPNDAAIRHSMANETNEQSITRKHWFLHEARPVPVTAAPKTKRLAIDERSNVERPVGKQQVKIEYVVPGNSIQFVQSTHPPFSCSQSFFSPSGHCNWQNVHQIKRNRTKLFWKSAEVVRPKKEVLRINCMSRPHPWRL